MPETRRPQDADIRDCVDAALNGHVGVPGALLPILQAVQKVLGYVPPQAVAPIAEALNLSRTEIHGVLSFYHDLFGEITADAAWSLDAVYCLGNCACGPCVRIDDAVHGRVDAQRLAVLLGAAAAEPGA